MIPNLTLNVAHLPDRENPVVEVWCGETQFGELSCESGLLRLEIYPGPAGKPWQLGFEEILQILDQAKNRLAEITGAALDSGPTDPLE